MTSTVPGAAAAVVVAVVVVAEVVVVAVVVGLVVALVVVVVSVVAVVGDVGVVVPEVHDASVAITVSKMKISSPAFLNIVFTSTSPINISQAAYIQILSPGNM